MITGALRRTRRSLPPGWPRARLDDDLYGVGQLMRRGSSPRKVCGAIALAAALLLGVSTASAGAAATPQVVGGSTAPITTAPFTVALHFAGLDAYDGLQCGGVIVDATHVLTAAHCLLDPFLGGVDPPGMWSVLAGTATLPLVSITPVGAVDDPVVQTAFDPSYDPSTGNNDIGILTLARPLWTGGTPPLDGASTIAPVPVATPAQAGADDAPGEAVTTFGWGYDEPITPNGNPVSNGYPTALHSAPLSLISDAQCTQELQGTGMALAASQLCATGSPPDNASACYGDSGGPLVLGGAGGPGGDVLVGLVDMGYGCGEGFPDIGTNVAETAVSGFLQSNPPQAPYETVDTTISGVGPTLTCNSGGWVGNPTLTYQFFIDNGDPSTQDPLSAVQSSPTFTVGANAFGLPTYCVVTADNAGGFGSAFSDDEVTPQMLALTSNVTSNVTNSAPPPLSTQSVTTTSTTTSGNPSSPLPSLHVLSHTCARHKCAVIVTGVEAGGPGVLTVDASLHELARVACRVGRRKTTCARTIRKPAAVTHLSGGRFQIAAYGLPIGSYTLALVAVDRAGHLQAHPTTVSLRVSR